jgi:hypothetical protein
MDGFPNKEAAEKRLAEWREKGVPDAKYSYVIGPSVKKEVEADSRIPAQRMAGAGSEAASSHASVEIARQIVRGLIEAADQAGYEPIYLFSHESARQPKTVTAATALDAVFDDDRNIRLTLEFTKARANIGKAGKPLPHVVLELQRGHGVLVGYTGVNAEFSKAVTSYMRESAIDSLVGAVINEHDEIESAAHAAVALRRNAETLGIAVDDDVIDEAVEALQARIREESAYQDIQTQESGWTR